MEFIEEFIKELELVEKHTKLIDKIKIEEDEKTLDIGMIVFIIIDFKNLIYKRDILGESLNDDERTFISKLEERIEKDNLWKKLSENLDIEYKSGEDEYKIIVQNTSLLNFIRNISESSKDSYYEEEQIIFKNTLYNLCTLVEKYYGLIYKDYLMNHLNYEAFSDEKINYAELMKIGNISDAKIFLIDRKLKGMFGESFSNWNNMILKQLNINSKLLDFDKKTISSIEEIYNLRNLFIHSDGIVNDMFLTKTKKYADIKKGEKIQLNIDELEEYKNTVFNIMLSLFYNYGIKIHKSNPEKYERYMSEINNNLINYVKTKATVIPHLFEKLSEDSKIGTELQYYGKVNKLIYEYLHDTNTFIEDIEQFDCSALSNDFKLAKFILKKDKENVLKYLIQILDEEEDKIFDVFSWPLIQIAASNHDEVKELLNRRINDILK